jgi:hypothetical protein
MDMIITPYGHELNSLEPKPIPVKQKAKRETKKKGGQAIF